MAQGPQFVLNLSEILVDATELGLLIPHEPRVWGDSIFDPADRPSQFMLKLITHHLDQASFQFIGPFPKIVPGQTSADGGVCGVSPELRRNQTAFCARRCIRWLNLP